MQRGEQAVCVGTLRIERAVGQEARAVQRDTLLQTGSRIILDELDGSATGEEGVDHIGFERSDFGQQGLELDTRERHAQILDDLATGLLERFAETPHRFVTRRVLVRDGDGLLGALLGSYFAHGIGRLPVGKGTAEDVRRAHAASHGIGASVGNNHQGVGVLGDFRHRHGHARVHGADQHIDVVALDQFVHVVGGFGRIGLVVDLHVLDLTATDLAALLGNKQAKTVFNRRAKRGVSAGIGQHQTDLEFAGVLGHGQGRCNDASGNQAGTK